MLIFDFIQAGIFAAQMCAIVPSAKSPSGDAGSDRER
jgi:hypothetical protein